MTIQPRNELRGELAELAAIHRHREITDPQHTAGSGTEGEPMLTEQWTKSNRSNNNGSCVQTR